MDELPSETVRAAASAIIGADELQRSERRVLVPPTPRFPRTVRVYLELVGVAMVGDAIYHFATGRISAGIWILILTPVAVSGQWLYLDRWQRMRRRKPEYETE